MNDYAKQTQSNPIANAKKMLLPDSSLTLRTAGREAKRDE